MSGTSPSSSTPPLGPGSSAAAPSGSVCAFWLGGRAYALDTAVVGEVVNVEAALPVPGTPPAVQGLFNLRGTPVALVDLGLALDLPGTRSVEGRGRTVLVLRWGEVSLAGVLIDRMELVVQVGQGTFTARDPADDHPVVLGFLEVKARGGLIFAVLDPVLLLQQLERLRFR